MQIITALPKKMFVGLGTVPEDAALCSSDSDLLPPRSRYPLKWARNRQPSPPPVALPGPLLSGPPHSKTLTGPRAVLRASGLGGWREWRTRRDRRAAPATAASKPRRAESAPPRPPPPRPPHSAATWPIPGGSRFPRARGSSAG